jgi:hypothetical protein
VGSFSVIYFSSIGVGCAIAGITVPGQLDRTISVT